MYLITNKVVNSKSVYKTAFHMYWYTPLFLSRETDLLLWNLIIYQSDSRKTWQTFHSLLSQDSFIKRSLFDIFPFWLLETQEFPSGAILSS